MSRYGMPRVPFDTIDFAPTPPPVRPVGAPPKPGRGLVAELQDLGVIVPEEWDELTPAAQHEVQSAWTEAETLEKLVGLHLLTRFQADTIRGGGARDLVLGHYRLLGVLGRGGMGVVYRAENTALRREVAVKVFTNTQDTCPRMVRRFYAEARAAARLQHPNLVPCLDAGRHQSADPGAPVRDYYVMELINGQDLDALVRGRGPLPVARACDLFRQVSEALAEAHRLGLIHRDIKPGNVFITPDWQAKVLDFGLALHPNRRMTEPGTLLGTVGYMAPEQARDPHAVDARADLFSVGATMYWALTGREPYPETGNPIRDLHTRFTAPPPPVQQHRPELPEELCTLVNRLLSTDPDARPPSARVVAITLGGLSRWTPRPAPASVTGRVAPEKPRVVLVEDEESVRDLLKHYLGDEFAVTEAEDGDGLLAALARQPADLVVLDVNLPGASGCELIDAVRAAGAEGRRPMVLLMSGAIPPESLGGLLAAGADDFLAKPFSRSEFRSRVRGLLGRRPGVPQADPAQTPPPGVPVLPVNRVGLLTGVLTQMLQETLAYGPTYGERLGRYVRALAATAPDEGEYARLKDGRFLDLLAAVAPLHDLGMMGVPQAILRKPEGLDGQERMVLQTHAVMGAEWVAAVAAGNPEEVSVLALAVEVIRHHHERWDGDGYPDALAEDQIPLAARVVGLVSVYDALRSRRAYRPGLSHARVVRMLVSESPGKFDPTLVAALSAAAARFDKIFQMAPE